MTLLDPRMTFSPFEYQWAYSEYWLKQQSAHWLPTEIQMSSDINDWKLNLSENEKNVIGNILKGFVSSEIFIEDYWLYVSKTFKKPEIQMMASCFANMESIHAVSYSLLEETLGIQDHEGFLHEPTAKAKIDRLVNCKGKTKEEIALSLAVFSAFNEGVNLFSSFAVLLSFSRRNLLKGVGKIIEFSIKDETLHSNAGCHLFRQFISEFPSVMTDEFKKQVYEAARITVALEDDFIDKAFELGSIDGVDSKDLKNYIRFRANTKLQDLGFKSNWKNIDKESLERMTWFSVLSSGSVSQDFFAGREAGYSKGIVDFEDVWDTLDQSKEEINAA